MDLSNLNPALEDKDSDVEVEEKIELPLTDEPQPVEGTDLTARVVTDKDEIEKIQAEKAVNNIMIDAVTRTVAQLRLEACENDVTFDAVYNNRLQSIMDNDKLDENGFKLAKQVLDSAIDVAKELGAPDKEDTQTIFLLAKVATGEFNPREEMEAVKLSKMASKSPRKISKKELDKKRKKNKAARKARRKGRKK